METTTPDKRYVWRLATMIGARLIWWEHFAPWADELIMQIEKPPSWLLDLSTTQYSPKAEQLLREWANSPPAPDYDPDEDCDDYLACLLLRYRTGAISWATFLFEGGQQLDSVSGRRHCEWLFQLLTELEHAEYSGDVEQAQRASVEAEIRDALERVEPVFKLFLDFYRRPVRADPT